MKAKVKETGEVVNVVRIIEYSEKPGTSFAGDYMYYKDESNNKPYNEDELDFTNIYPDWQQVRIQAAIAAMQGAYSNKMFDNVDFEGIAKASVIQADALIEELKKKK